MSLYYKIEEYTQKNHKKVNKLIPNSGECEYYGYCILNLPDGSKTPFQFKFPDNIKTVKKCFDLFDQIADFQLGEIPFCNSKKLNELNNEKVQFPQF